MCALPQIDLTTPAKRGEYARILEAMVELRERLRKMAERYPIFILAADRTYVSESPDDIDALMVGIDLQLAEHRARS
jgi:hypothetical protein